MNTDTNAVTIDVEGTETPSSDKSSSQAALTSPSAAFNGKDMRIIAICLFLSILASALVSWVLVIQTNKHKEIVVLDVKKIVDARTKQFTDAYKDKEPTLEVKQAMDRDTRLFAQKINAALERVSKDRIVLPKDGVLSENTKDITDEFAKELNN